MPILYSPYTCCRIKHTQRPMPGLSTLEYSALARFTAFSLQKKLRLKRHHVVEETKFRSTHLENGNALSHLAQRRRELLQILRRSRLCQWPYAIAEGGVENVLVVTGMANADHLSDSIA